MCMRNHRGVGHDVPTDACGAGKQCGLGLRVGTGRVFRGHGQAGNALARDLGVSLSVWTGGRCCDGGSKGRIGVISGICVAPAFGAAADTRSFTTARPPSRAQASYPTRALSQQPSTPAQRGLNQSTSPLMRVRETQARARHASLRQTVYFILFYFVFYSF